MFNGRVVFVYTGSLEKQKGILLLLDIIRNLSDDYINKSLFKFIGDGSYVQELIKVQGETKNIVYYGTQPNRKALQIMNSSDACIVPSIWPEPLARVLMESKHMNLPIICFDVGGNRDIIKYGKNDFMIDFNAKTAQQDLRTVILNFIDRTLGDTK